MAIYLKSVLWLYPVYQYGLWIIAGIFIYRVIGEFDYVCFFKKYKHIQFGKNNTLYYGSI